VSASIFGDQLCRHQRKICSVCMQVDDAAKRAYDVVREIVGNLSYEERTAYPYVALKLSDGSSDGKNYDTKREAVAAQFHEQLCAYFSFRLAPNGFATPRDAAIFLAYHRAAYDAGARLPDPDAPHGGRDLIMPTTPEHLGGQLRRFGVN
jgi:hypothetical protein